MNCKVKLNRKQTGLNLYKTISNSPYTYEEIASFLELASPRVIYEWTRGTKLPTLENLLNLSLLFHVQIEDILF